MEIRGFFLACLFLITPTTSFAADQVPVKPILIGYSTCNEYQEGCYNSELDESCPADYEDYTLAQNSRVYRSQRSFLEEHKKQLPNYDSCHWDTTLEVINGSSPDIDSGFPFGESSKFKDMYHSFRVSSFCKNSDGYIQYSSFEHAHTVFKCPTGTKYNWDLGCTIPQRTICTGDIIGREMSTKFLPLADQGHVGLVFNLYDEDEEEIIPIVIEVLNNERVLDFSLLSDFMAVSKYWGEKYGINSDRPSFEQIAYAVYALWDLVDLQEEGIQFRYTFSSEPTYNPPGKFFIYDIMNNKWFTKIEGPSIAFRCDSFVKYLYEQAPGVKFNYVRPLTPRNLFRGLSKIRNGRDPLFSAWNTMSLSTDNAEQYIRALFIDDKFDGNYEKVIENYIKNKMIPENEKISFFISILEQVSFNEDKFIYLIDILAPLQPFRFFDQLKNISERDDSPSKKRYIHILLSESIKFKTQKDVDSLSQSDIDMIIRIQKYLNKPQVTIKTNGKLRKFIPQIKRRLKQLKSLNVDVGKRIRVKAPR